MSVEDEEGVVAQGGVSPPALPSLQGAVWAREVHVSVRDTLSWRGS